MVVINVLCLGVNNVVLFASYVFIVLVKFR